MLPLSTRAHTEGVTAPLVLKVVTLEDVAQHGWPLETAALWLPDELQARPAPSVFHLPWGACIPRSAQPSPPAWHGPWIHRLQEPGVVAPGDVIAIRPGSATLTVLYRRGAKSNTLFVTERCNSLCLMCSQPPKTIDDGWRVQELLALIRLIDKDEAWLGITGGEPSLLGPQLFTLRRLMTAGESRNSWR